MAKYKKNKTYRMSSDELRTLEQEGCPFDKLQQWSKVEQRKDNEGLLAHPAVKTSMLAEDTMEMDRERRYLEQDGHRRLARLHAKDHDTREVDKALEQSHGNEGPLQHPSLDNQRYDGVDPNVSPEPPLNSDARREFDNARREQDLEKQLRMGNQPGFSSAPKPRGAQ